MLCDRSPLLPMRWLLARKWPRMHRAPECYWQPMAPKLTSCLIWFIRWLTWTPENSPPREKEFYNWLPLCNARKSYWFSTTSMTSEATEVEKYHIYDQIEHKYFFGKNLTKCFFYPFRFFWILANSSYLQYKRISKNLKEFSRGKKESTKVSKCTVI